MEQEQKYLTVSELAKMRNVSRQAIFRKIKNKQIEAEKIGRFYVIPKSALTGMVQGDLSEKLKHDINKGVFKAVKEYGETLRLLGRE